MNYKELQGNTIDLFEYLYNHPEIPPKKSIIVDLKFDEQGTIKDFLTDAIVYGFQKKFSRIPKDQYTQAQFSKINQYINAIGFNVVLKQYDYNNGKIILDFDYSLVK